MSPISAPMVNASTHPIPGHGEQQRDIRMVGAAGAPLAVDEVDLGVEVVDQRQARLDGAAPRLGNREALQRVAGGGAEQTRTGHGCSNVISVAWMRCLSIERCLTRCNRKRACSRSARTRG